MNTTLTPPVKRRKDRDPSNTVTSFSISKELLKDAQDICREDKRSLSNWLAVLFEREIRARKKQRDEGGGANTPNA